jgi:polyisoprenoid-binding protein YceI
MQTIKTILLPVTIAAALSMVCIFTLLSTSCKHCSSKFSGQVENFNLELFHRTDIGNPLGDMKISFDINPNTLNACNDSSLSEKLKSPGFFMNEEEDKITFKTIQVNTLGIDWYQVNGKLSIKSVEHNVVLYATGIRGEDEIYPTELVLQGQVYLLDWGIDFDLFLFGTAQSPTSWLHLNMVIDLEN